MTQQLLFGGASSGLQPIMDASANDGQVKINTGNGVKPRWDDSTVSINNTWQKVTYTLPLGLSSSPTTSWPNNIATPTDADIYDVANDTFIENTIPGQINNWRLQFQFNKQNSQTSLEVQLKNTLSGFELDTFFTIVSGFTDGFFFVVFTTIADGASLPAPFGTGQGYEFRVKADTNSFQQGPTNFLEVVSLTRISPYFGSAHK